MNRPEKFKKKPVEIEAWQVPELKLGDSVMRYLDKCLLVAEWCGATSYMLAEDDEKAFEGATVVGPHIAITTLEGVMAALPNDYIIKGVQGEFYPCKPSIFVATYDKVGD